jgi:hypothetical protein
LALPSVPRKKAWKLFGKAPGFISFTAELKFIAGYCGQAVKAIAATGAKGLHASLKSPGGTKEALSVARTRKFTYATTATPGNDAKPVLFALLHSDSRMRIVFGILLLQLTHSRTVVGQCIYKADSNLTMVKTENHHNSAESFPIETSK